MQKPGVNNPGTKSGENTRITLPGSKPEHAGLGIATAAFETTRSSQQTWETAVSNDPKLSAIHQIAITVSDVDIALRFYRDVLGIPFLFSAGPELAFLDAGGVRLMLGTPQGAGSIGHNSILYFRVSDIVAMHAALVARGAANERAPALAARMTDHELWTGFLRDPDGNLVGLMEEKR